MGGLLSLAIGPIGKIVGAGVLALSLGGGVALWFREHDARILAEVAAKQAVVVAAAQHAQDQRTISGLTQSAAQAVARVAATSKLKASIDATPSSNVCADSPAARAFLAGVRGGSIGGNASAAPAAAAGGVVLP